MWDQFRQAIVCTALAHVVSFYFQTFTMWDSCASAHNAASGNGDPTRRNRRQIIQRQSTFYLFPRETESNKRSIFVKKEHPTACEVQKCQDDCTSSTPSSPVFEMSWDMQRKLGKRRFISEKKERDGFRSIRRPNRQIVPWRSKTALIRRNFPPPDISWQP